MAVMTPRTKQGQRTPQRQFTVEPISLRRAKAADVEALWKRSAERVASSRARQILCRDIRRNTVGVTIDEYWMGGAGAQMAEYLEVALPDRQTHDLNLINLLREFDPEFERIPLGTTDTARKDADQLEVWCNSVAEQHIDWDTIVSLSVQDGELGVAVLPDTAVMDVAPSYLDEEGKPDPVYDRDKSGRPSDDEKYGGRDEQQSAKAHDDELLAWMATHPPYRVRVINATDCAPILVPGIRSRWECQGLIVRTLYDVEELIERGYRWEDMGNRLLIPRSFDAQNTYGQCGQVYLYELYVMLEEKDESGKPELHPAIVYSVGGKQTWGSESTSKEDAVIRDLDEEFELCEPMWGYFYGLHFDDDPEFRGVPYLWPLVASITNLEGLLTAHNCHTWANSFGGHVIVPDETTDPDMYIDGEAGSKKYRTFTPPKIGEVKIMPGNVVPFAQAQVGRDAPYLEGILGESIRQASPDPSATGGDGSSSARQLVVQDALLKAGKQQIRQCVLDAAEFIMSRILMICCAMLKRDQQIRIPVYATQERTIGDGKSVAERTTLVLKERWVRQNYALKATFPTKGSLAEIEQAMSSIERGLGTYEDLIKLQGKKSVDTELVKIAVTAYWRSPAGQTELQKAAQEYRGYKEQQERDGLIAAGQMTPDGVPMEALPPELLAMMMGGQQQPGMPNTGMGPATGSPTALPNMAASSLAGTIGGEMMTGPMMGEQAALAGVGGG